MKFMQVAALLLGTLLSRSALAQELPELVCQTLEEITVIHSEPFQTVSLDTQDVYRLSNGKLYLSSPTREEYEYGDLISVELNRYVSGYKTLLFGPEGFNAAIEVHTDAQRTRIRRLNCIRT